MKKLNFTRINSLLMFYETKFPKNLLVQLYCKGSFTYNIN